MVRGVFNSNPMRRILGILLLIPGLLQVPLPQADYHVVRHHHGVGEICPQHDHLLRWHPQAAEGSSVAVLHWHWLPPRSLDPSDLDDSGRSTPALHAHQTDPLLPELDSAPMIVSDDRGREGRSDLHSIAGLIDVVWTWVGVRVETSPQTPFSAGADSRRLSPAEALSRLVRWNC